MNPQNKFDQYIDQAITQLLESSSHLDENQKKQMGDKIRKHFYNLILTTTLDNLTDEQFLAIKDLAPEDPILAQKLEEFSQEIPFLAENIQEKIDKDLEYMKQNSQIPPQEKTP